MQQQKTLIWEVVNALGTVETAEETKSALHKLVALFSHDNDPVISFELFVATMTPLPGLTSWRVVW